ncbi:SDR family NAD(P)-dependent oxidoreductase [Acidisoma sp.]|uniref:SDR family NAD(P)-dependent oxidoreductase n=1 Tax=Acidisoma sp. TaxID=1872115 RepID=UPI003AFFFC22
MDHKTAVITGGTSGLGRWVAAGLAKAGYTLTLIARDRDRAAATIAWIRSRTADAVLEVEIADLSSLAETRAVAAAILSRTPRLDLLVNNAGVVSPKRVQTAEGHERTLATNLLSPLALTEALLPALKAAAPSRIVMVGSSSSDRARIDPDNLELERRWSMVRAYSQSKLALLMTSRTLAKRLEGSGVTVNVVHPGLVATDIVRHGGIVGVVWKLMAPFSLTPEQGAATPLYACLSPEMTSKSGLYLKRGRPATPNPLVNDAALSTRVMAATEQLLS